MSLLFYFFCNLYFAADITSPTFVSCPSDIRESITANSSALVNWTVPVAVDNSRTPPNLTVSPREASPPYTFYQDTLIVYTAKDAAGNEKECSFKVTLEGQLIYSGSPDFLIPCTLLQVVSTRIKCLKRHLQCLFSCHYFRSILRNLSLVFCVQRTN